MKRYLYLFPLMAFTAATLTLAACDDKKEEAAPAEQTTAAPETTDASSIPSAPTVNVTDATAYATAPGGTNGAIFLTLTNAGTETDKLVGATTDVASMAEIHEVTTDASGIAQMRKIDGVEIGAGQQATLSPEGYHIMLMGLSAPLTDGQTFNVTLDFDKSADVVVPVSVKTLTPPPADAMMAPTGVGPSTDATTHESMTPPADGTIPAETTPTDEPTTAAPATDAPADADTTSSDAPVSEDVQEEPTPVQ